MPLPDTPRQNGLFRFGIFELNGRTGELRKDGKTGPRLSGQPLELLLQLLEHPGELVTREELRQRLWPADTFVDYDHSLNTAVNKLREALNDSADSPRFIQTIPRRGYRFIAPLELSGEAAARVTAANHPTPLRTLAGAVVKVPVESRAGLLSDPQELPSIPRGRARLLFSLLQGMYLSFYVFALANLSGVDAALARLFSRPSWAFMLLIATAAAGVPIRLYLLSAAVFGYRGLTGRFQKLFPVLFPLDELWALAPFLLVDRIGLGLALAATAALLFLPFSQRSVLYMGDGGGSSGASS
jgi:DNA-binding winged helix-turn-helix (wHTH) protein